MKGSEEEFMHWVSDLARVVDWTPRGTQIAWMDIEQRLGTALPTDFKEFCECFSQGEFSGYLEVFSTSDGAYLALEDVLHGVQRTVKRAPIAREPFLPYGL